MCDVSWQHRMVIYCKGGQGSGRPLTFITAPQLKQNNLLILRFPSSVSCSMTGEIWHWHAQHVNLYDAYQFQLSGTFTKRNSVTGQQACQLSTNHTPQRHTLSYLLANYIKIKKNYSKKICTPTESEGFQGPEYASCGSLGCETV